MNKEEALAVVRHELASYRGRGYRELLCLLSQCDELEAVGPSGARYRIQVEAVWDDRPNGDLRVIGLVDDGSLRQYVCPLNDDFIIRSDGSFVGE